MKDLIDIAIDLSYSKDMRNLFLSIDDFEDSIGLVKNKIKLPSFTNLNNKQKEVLKLVNATRGNLFLILHGGVRSGKTYIAIYIFISKVMKSPRGSLFLATGYSLNSLQTNIEQVFDDLGLRLNVDYRYNGQTYRYNLLGRIIRLCGANNKRSYSNIKGCTAVGWYANEATEQDKLVIDQCHLRVSKGRTFKIWDTNPSSHTHYIYTDYISQAENKKILIKHFVTEDNRENLTEGYIEEQRRLLTEEAQKVYLEGQWLDSVDMPFINLTVSDIHESILHQSHGARMAFLDPAIGYSDTASKSALSIIIGYNGVYFFFGRLFKGLWAKHTKEIALLLNRFNINTFYYENNLIGEGAVELDDTFMLYYKGDYVRSIRNTTNKIARISNLVTPIRQEALLAVSFCDPDYLESVKYANLKDEKNAQLDAVDSLESCYRILFS